MKIGVFDSGLGGLAVARAIRARLPQYDYLYLGDTKRVPYGGRSQETIHEFTVQALDFLFAQDCRIVVLACNTASSEALRRSQQQYLPARYPERRVLGVTIPCAEDAARFDRVAVLGTRATVASGVYPREIQARNPSAQVFQLATPLLVPLLENGGDKYLDTVLEDYIRALPDAQALVLGCTHYGVLADRVRGRGTWTVIRAEDSVPPKLADYLERHPEHEQVLSRGESFRAIATDLPPAYEELAVRFFGEPIALEKVDLCGT